MKRLTLAQLDAAMERLGLEAAKVPTSLALHGAEALGRLMRLSFVSTFASPLEPAAPDFFGLPVEYDEELPLDVYELRFKDGRVERFKL